MEKVGTSSPISPLSPVLVEKLTNVFIPTGVHCINSELKINKTVPKGNRIHTKETELQVLSKNDCKHAWTTSWFIGISVSKRYGQIFLLSSRVACTGYLPILLHVYLLQCWHITGKWARRADMYV